MAGTRSGEAKLAELFAAGEISEDEYRHRLTVLKEQQP
ncbi:MAG: SHOCT domain-containing protein [Nocardioidaceae bacterium]